MEIEPGLRVVRGPDWKWGDQDGGEGCLGTVAESTDRRETPEGVVIVQWDAGNRCKYRCGIDGKYDLKIYDNAPTGNRHPHITCDSCRTDNIPGIRWKCTKCYDFDLCTPCYYAAQHSLEHNFLRIDKNKQKSVIVPPRKSSKRTLAKGFFPDAEVVRGHDWLWGDQDGGLGNSGKVKTVKDHLETARSIVEVEWMGSRKMNIYRAGHKGKVDVRCSTIGVGNHYYPEHLPILGAPAPVEDNERGQSAVPMTMTGKLVSPTFVSGDRVKVTLELEIFKMMQNGHGGWTDEMAEILSEVGTVHSILDSGDLRVQYASGNVWTMNPDTVVTVHDDVKEFVPGDVVRVLDDIAKVHNLQENHGGWVDDMALSLGQVGRVARVFPTGDVRVVVNGKTWSFNPACLTPAPGENPPEIPASAGAELDLEDVGLQLKVLSLMGNPATVVAAAAAGDADTIRDFLSRNPHDVNTKHSGKAALHCASVAGNIPVMKALLEFNPDLEIEDEDGDKPLHLCAYTDEDEATKLLIERGAKVNSTNKNGTTPLIIAAVKGHHSVLRVLVNHPTIQLHEQDSDGDTALHCAVLAQKNESVSILLAAGADPTRINFRLFTPIHEAARIGFLPAIEQFARTHQDLNLKKEDGFAAIHLAALNDHLDVTTALAESLELIPTEVERRGHYPFHRLQIQLRNKLCRINAVTNTGQTALHLAVHQGHARIVERLVGYGIELNLQDSDGDTALHLALSRQTVNVLSAETPQLKKVRDSFGVPGDIGPHAIATVACFLIQEGANMLLCNKKGNTPLQACSPEVVSLVMTFKDSPAIRSPLKFHGSLRPPDVTSPPAAPPVTMFSVGGGGKNNGLTVGAPNPPPLVAQPQPPVSKATVPSQPAAAAPSNDESCFLCESLVDVKFEPCGHALMCSTCAQRAKKCPECKAVVKTISKVKVMCPMCNEDEATVTMRPCGHQFCPGCGRRMKKCFDCRIDITSKEGLPPETSRGESVDGGGNQSNCAICLTEPRNTALLCGHQLCWTCAQRVDHCPVCRKFVTHRIQLFQ